MTFPIATDLQGLLDQNVKFFVTCWRIVRTDGVTFRFTDHDSKITFLAETFVPAGGFNASARQAQSGFEIQNLEIMGILTSSVITHDDLRAGLYREAAVTELIFDSRYPWAGVILETRYFITETKFSGEHWEASMEGLTRKLTQKVGDLYNRECRHELGDDICQVDIDALKENGTVTVISTSNADKRSKFESSGLTAVDAFFASGKLLWTAGLNNGLLGEVKTYDLAGPQEIELFLPMPFDIAVNDTFTVFPGCDKLLTTCDTKFDNLDNFGGFPFIPGTDRMLQTPTR